MIGHRRILWVILVLFALALGACAEAGDALPGTGGETDELANTQWRLTSYGPAGAETPVTGDNDLTLIFVEGDQIAGQGGCNQFSGSYIQTADGIDFDSLVQTEMACEGAGIMEQERTFIDALNNASGYTLSGDELQIAYGDGEILNFERQE